MNFGPIFKEYVGKTSDERRGFAVANGLSFDTVESLAEGTIDLATEDAFQLSPALHVSAATILRWARDESAPSPSTQESSEASSILNGSVDLDCLDSLETIRSIRASAPNSYVTGAALLKSALTSNNLEVAIAAIQELTAEDDDVATIATLGLIDSDRFELEPTMSLLSAIHPDRAFERIVTLLEQDGEKYRELGRLLKSIDPDCDIDLFPTVPDFLAHIQSLRATGMISLSPEGRSNDGTGLTESERGELLVSAFRNVDARNALLKLRASDVPLFKYAELALR